MSKGEVEWPAEGLEQVTSCPICGAQERRLLFKGLVDRVFAVAPGHWDLFRCERCASVYLDPRPTPASIGLAYSGYYTHSEGNQRIVRRIGRIRSLVHDLVNGYQNQRFGTRWSHANRLGRWLLPMLPPLRAAADAECRHMPPLPVNGGRMLDIGSGNGSFLALAANCGWEALGVDFDLDAVQSARSRGLHVLHGGIEVLDGQSEAFDVITLCHVIEHVHAPVALLERIYRLLKPDGVLWLDTPNISSDGASRYGRNWRDLDPPRHLVLFNRVSLVDSLHEVGFHTIRQKWRGMSVFDVYAASDAIACGKIGAEGSYRGRPPWYALRDELLQMLFPSKREFLTLTAKK